MNKEVYLQKIVNRNFCKYVLVETKILEDVSAEKYRDLAVKVIYEDDFGSETIGYFLEPIHSEKYEFFNVENYSGSIDYITMKEIENKLAVFNYYIFYYRDAAKILTSEQNG